MSVLCQAIAGLVMMYASGAAAFGGAWDEQIRAAAPGQVLRIELPELDEFPTIPVTITAGGPPLVFSDKPEYFRTGNGIAMQEEVQPGVVRFYLYHVPEPTDKLKTISAVIENLGDGPMQFHFLRRAFPQPSGHYFLVGKTGLIEFFTPPQHPAPVRTLLPGGRMPIDVEMDRAVVMRDQLVHGFYEFKIDQPGRITVFQRDPEQDSTMVIDELPLLPSVLPGQQPSGAGRGLFPSSDRHVTNAGDFVLDTADGPMRLVIADGDRDRWITGRDSIDGTDDAINKGNYGVVYTIRLKRSSSDGRGLAVLTWNPFFRAEWCRKQASAMIVSDGVFPGGLVSIPADEVMYGGPEEMVLIQRFPPVPPGETDEIELIFSPPGASCLPVPLLFVPYEETKSGIGD